MTPAVDMAKRAKIAFTLHEYDHDPGSSAYGMEAVEKLGLNPDEVFKTLVVELQGGELVVAVVPVSSMLNLKALAKAAGAKKAAMADAPAVSRSSGYVLGGVSPLGQKRALRTFMDSSAERLSVMYVSAGRRGLEIALSPRDLQGLTRAGFAPLAQE